MNPTAIKIKVWADGTAEPATWNVNVTDSTAVLQAAGGAGLQTYAGGSSSYPLVFSFDDFTVRPANLPPVASFTSNCAGSLGCSFDASASTDDAAIVAYDWVYGDGSTGTGVAPAHTFASAGTFAVTLSVTDAQGVVHVVSQSVNVT
jgi:PKD repeat protein